jgi:hypothetical protein
MSSHGTSLLSCSWRLTIFFILCARTDEFLMPFYYPLVVKIPLMFTGWLRSWLCVKRMRSHHVSSGAAKPDVGCRCKNSFCAMCSASLLFRTYWRERWQDSPAGTFWRAKKMWFCDVKWFYRNWMNGLGTASDRRSKSSGKFCLNFCHARLGIEFSNAKQLLWNRARFCD